MQQNGILVRQVQSRFKQQIIQLQCELEYQQKRADQLQQFKKISLEKYNSDQFNQKLADQLVARENELILLSQKHKEKCKQMAQLEKLHCVELLNLREEFNRSHQEKRLLEQQVTQLNLQLAQTKEGALSALIQKESEIQQLEQRLNNQIHNQFREKFELLEAQYREYVQNKIFEVQKLQNHINQLTEQIDSMRQQSSKERVHFSQSIQKIEIEYNQKLQSNLSSKQQLKENLNSHLQNLKMNYQENVSQIKQELEKQKLNAEKCKGKLEKKLETLKNQLEIMNNKYEELKQKEKTLASDKKQLEKDLIQKEQLHCKYVKKVEDLEQVNSNLQLQIGKLKQFQESFAVIQNTHQLIEQQQFKQLEQQEKKQTLQDALQENQSLSKRQLLDYEVIYRQNIALKKYRDQIEQDQQQTRIQNFQLIRENQELRKRIFSQNSQILLSENVDLKNHIHKIESNLISTKLSFIEQKDCMQEKHKLQIELYSQKILRLNQKMCELQLKLDETNPRTNLIKKYLSSLK